MNLTINDAQNNKSMLNTSSHCHLPTDSEVIFYESVPIIVKVSMMETNTRHLTLKIEKLVQLPQNQSILSITLTDETDPYFLYTLSVSESDFHRLKSDQTLLVDFAVFPQSLVMLLRQCLQCKNEEHPKFVAVLVYSSNAAILSVQETNQFRHLQHISLKLMASNADKLRDYLGQTLMRFKNENGKLLKNLTSKSQSLQRAKSDKKQAEAYVASIKQKYEECLCELKTSHSATVSQIKAEHLEQIEEIRKELIGEKQACEKELKLVIKTNDLRHQKCKNQFDELKAVHFRLESKSKNQAISLHDLQIENESNKKALTELREEAKKLDALKFEYEKQINEHLINMSAMKQQIKDKGEIAMNNSNLLLSEQAQKKSMEEQCQLYKANSEKQEKKIKECIKEINKGNSIISHLQNEIRNQRNKNKLKEQKLANMEQVNSNKSDGMSRLEENLKEKEAKIEKLQSEAKEYKNTLISCKNKLQESQKAIESNQRVIAYLNKQLNDNQMGGNMFSSNLTPSPYSGLSQQRTDLNVSRSKYTSPYLSKMGGGTSGVIQAPLNASRDSDRSKIGMTGLSGMG